MINKIKSKYQKFSDAIIYKVEYIPVPNDDSPSRLSVFLTCLNCTTDQWEHVELIFESVVAFRYIETPKVKNTIIFNALMSENEGLIIVDFFPLEVDGISLAEDPNSDFSVHAAKISYHVLGLA